jgi:hypothetical protein
VKGNLDKPPRKNGVRWGCYVPIADFQEVVSRVQAVAVVYKVIQSHHMHEHESGILLTVTLISREVEEDRIDKVLHLRPCKQWRRVHKGEVEGALSHEGEDA